MYCRVCAETREAIRWQVALRQHTLRVVVKPSVGIGTPASGGIGAREFLDA
jgi:hypothetical protein